MSSTNFVDGQMKVSSCIKAAAGPGATVSRATRPKDEEEDDDMLTLDTTRFEVMYENMTIALPPCLFYTLYALTDAKLASAGYQKCRNIRLRAMNMSGCPEFYCNRVDGNIREDLDRIYKEIRQRGLPPLIINRRAVGYELTVAPDQITVM